MVRRAPGATQATVYDISSRRLAPLQASLQLGVRATAAEKRARRKIELQERDTDLIQDFQFPTVSHRVKLSPDGRFIFATGTYPPQLHVYDTDQLSLKFKRHVDNEIVDFQILEQDWRKFALLTADRYVDLHSPFGSHFKTRVPRFGRDLMLHRGTCDLYVCGDGRDAWRLNLEQGRFLAPIPTHSGMQGGNNVCGISPVNSLLAFGGESGLVDIWDPRVAAQSKKPAGVLDAAAALAEKNRGAQLSKTRPQISALRFDERDGVSMAVGTNSGYTMLFDLRSPHAVLARDQGNGLPIRSIRLHEDGKHAITADARAVKVWQRSDGRTMATMEPDADVNHVCVVGGSGVICTAVESARVKTYYIPTLGTAPRWCAFLDSVTEELEDGRSARAEGEEAESIYENYKFVASDELESLGLAHLVGTDMLKAYMHGYFVSQKLYRRAVDVAEPFAYEKYRKEKARQKMEEERGSRISKKRGKKVKVNVNQHVAERLRDGRAGNKKAKSAASILEDDRFGAMFENTDYKVDVEAERFLHLNPEGARKTTNEDEGSDEEYLEQFELVDEDGAGDDEESESGSSDGESEDEVEDDGEGIAKERKRGVTRMYQLGKAGGMSERTGVVEAIDGANGKLKQKVRDEVTLGQRMGTR